MVGTTLSILRLTTCEVCGEERLMLMSIIVEVLKVEFDWVKVDFTVKLSCMLKQ